MALPSWIMSIFGHSIGEVTDAIWRVSTAEAKAGKFGSGWGDEHQNLELLAKLEDELEEQHRPIWMDFIRYNYIDRKGASTRFNARRQLKQLRLFLTSWDSEKKIGTKTTTTEDKELAKKVQLVEDVFKDPTLHALSFVVRCVNIILEKEEEELAKLKLKVAEKQQKADAKPGEKYIIGITKAGERHCREAGYIELVRYFQAAQLPVMPTPGDKHLTKSIDEWIETRLGTDVNPAEIAKAGLIWLGQSSTKRRARHKERMDWAWSRFYRWPTIPLVFVYNIYS